MERFIFAANEVLSRWRAQYDLLSEVPLEFSRSKKGKLNLNDHTLKICIRAPLRSAFYDSKHIIFDFDDDHEIQILMAWPVEQAPRVRTVLFI